MRLGNARSTNVRRFSIRFECVLAKDPAGARDHDEVSEGRPHCNCSPLLHLRLVPYIIRVPDRAIYRKLL